MNEQEASPSNRPIAVPMAPMVRPSTTKIFITLASRAPIDLRMEISLVFSSTSMISVLRMLKHATRTMKVRMMAIASFSSFSAEKRLRLSSAQSLVR